MPTVWWWTCPLYGCFHRMESHPDPAHVERDRDAHLAHDHPGESIEPSLLKLSHWPPT